MKDLKVLKEVIPLKEGEEPWNWEGEKVSMAEYKKRFVETYHPTKGKKS